LGTTSYLGGQPRVTRADGHTPRHGAPTKLLKHLQRVMKEAGSVCVWAA